MKISDIKIEWPNGHYSYAKPGTDWLKLAKEEGVVIPTGCLGGSCGACEIEINGKVIRSCVSNVPEEASGEIKVEFAKDPYWE